MKHGITWTEIAQNGVIRRMRTRDGWARRWDQRMSADVVEAPRQLPPLDVDPGPLPPEQLPWLAPDDCPGRQHGGRSEALATLHSFLTERGGNYHRELSSPLTAVESCSRLSPHLAFGTLSLRETAQAAAMQLRNLDGLPPDEQTTWKRALRAFIGRLHWALPFHPEAGGPSRSWNSSTPIGPTTGCAKASSTTRNSPPGPKAVLACRSSMPACAA